MFTEVDDKGFVTLTPRPEPYTYVFGLEEDVDVGPSPKYTVKVHKDQGVGIPVIFYFLPNLFTACKHDGNFVTVPNQ